MGQGHGQLHLVVVDVLLKAGGPGHQQIRLGEAIQ
jgi:hypothetical protein